MLKQGLFFVVYNKDVVCVMDQGASPICKMSKRSSRRNIDKINNLPSHDPFIPRSNNIYFDCTSAECKGIKLLSITQVTSPDLILKSCFEQEQGTYECETIRYNHLKNIDKLLFLSSNFPNKTFYAVDCLVYTDGGRVCHRKDGADSYPNLVDTGTIARPKETNVLAQDEFICEEGDNKEINCDLDPFIPFEDGLKLKEKVKYDGEILLKTGPYIVVLKRNCIDKWCGYSGRISPTRRASDTRYPYEPPGGWIYQCYYAKKQQICKPLYNPNRPEYFERDWINVCACGALAALDGYSQQQDPDQFHIQTDGDEDRYFIYQTHNGQYRKERRLKDGSVVGTTGWVGADGYLRLQDYIADSQGYRIYKSKTVYVGENRPIGESLNIAKTAPTDSGYGVTPAPAVQRTRAPPRVSSTTQAPPSSPHSFPAEVSVTPPPYVHPTSTPQVFVSPNSIDSSTTYDFRPTVPPITAAEATSTPNPYDYDSSNTNTLDDGYYASDSTRYDVYNPNSYRHADQWQRRQPPGAKIGNGYTPQFPSYDGVAFKRNGFRYYLPKQYHEEESGGSQERTGSFGYVDPFGIRRVIYYNTAPGEGFQVRKNNRYVGHDATPYDPRPIN